MIPEGESGRFRVRHVVPSEDDARFASLRMAIGGARRTTHGIQAGITIEHLEEETEDGWRLWMSDTQDERNDSNEFRWTAGGHVLMTGLGLGLAARQMAVAAVESVTIIERELDVIRLVEPTLMGLWDGKLTIVHDDAMTWCPPKGAGRKYTAIWHDIWSDICTDNLTEMTHIKRRYARWLVRGGWQGCWSEELLR